MSGTGDDRPGPPPHDPPTPVGEPPTEAQAAGTAGGAEHVGDAAPAAAAGPEPVVDATPAAEPVTEPVGDAAPAAEVGADAPSPPPPAEPVTEPVATAPVPPGPPPAAPVPPAAPAPPGGSPPGPGGRRLPRGLLLALVPAVALLVAIVGSRLAGDDEAAPSRSTTTVTTSTTSPASTVPGETTTTTETTLSEEPPPTTLPPETGARKLQGLEAGDCFNKPPDESVREVDPLDCEQPHTDEVYTVLTLRGSRYPANIDDQAEEGCYNAFVTFMGTDPEETPFAYDWYSPTPDEWGQGVRRVPCVIIDPDDKPLTGSAADAG